MKPEDIQKFCDAVETIGRELFRGNYVDSGDANLRVIGDMLPAVRAHLEQPRGWVSVEERLPEKIGEYFCVIHSTRENHSFVNALTFSTNTQNFDSILLRKGFATVTHWMPLPLLPGEEAIEKWNRRAAIPAPVPAVSVEKLEALAHSLGAFAEGTRSALERSGYETAAKLLWELIEARKP